MIRRVLVAGIGNIFLGDDAFGCEVVRELSTRELPEQVRVMDFGIRSYDLVYALTEGYDAVILVDATAQGEPPGTLYLIEPDLARLARVEPAPVDAHSVDPVRVLQLARSMGELPESLHLVGCEPDQAGLEEGRLGLSDAVKAVVPLAAERILSLLKTIVGTETTTNTGVVPV